MAGRGIGCLRLFFLALMCSCAAGTVRRCRRVTAAVRAVHGQDLLSHQHFPTLSLLIAGHTHMQADGLCWQEQRTQGPRDLLRRVRVRQVLPQHQERYARSLCMLASRRRFDGGRTRW